MGNPRTLPPICAVIDLALIATHCIQIWAFCTFGTPDQPHFVETVFQGVAQAGQPTILASPSSSNPAGDLIVSRAGLVSGFFAAGLVSAAVNSHYGTEMAVQIEYAPLGVPTGLCAALATPPDLRTLTSAANPSLRRSESAGVIEWRAV